MLRILIAFILTIYVWEFQAQSVTVIRSEVIENRNGQNFYIHDVQKGQTAYSIAKAYGISLEELYFENPAAKNALTIGQELIIPTVNKETRLKEDVKQTSFSFFYHIAAAQETFSHIANLYVIPEASIRQANPDLQDPLREGEYVKVPVATDLSAMTTPEMGVNQPLPRDNQSENRRKQTTTQANASTLQPDVTTDQVKNPVNKPAPEPRKPVVTKPASEFVTFDPNIPVIGDYRHVVIQGETTQSIAEKYGISIDLLKAANPGLGNSVIKGDRLRIPDKNKLGQENTTQPAAKAEEPQTTDPDITTRQENDGVIKPQENKAQEPQLIRHVVKKKETLYSIGRMYGVTVDDILKVNPGLTSSINIGQTINVPKKKISSPYLNIEVENKVRSKLLARDYLIDLSLLEESNPGMGKWLYPGQQIQMPVGNRAIIAPLEEGNPAEEEVTRVVDEPANTEQNPCISISPHRFEQFNVALMLPLYLEELDSLDKTGFLQEQQSGFQPFRFIGFYEGALLALDSLRSLGMNVNFHVYDVDQNLVKTAKAMKDPELRNMDLIIGPLFPEPFNQVASFASVFNIPVINPLTYRSEITQTFNTAIKMKPSNTSQVEPVTNYIARNHADSKVFIITQSAYEDAVLVDYLTNQIRNVVNPEIKVSNQELYTLAQEIAKRDIEPEEDHKNAVETEEIPLHPFQFEGQTFYPDLLEQIPDDSTTLPNPVTRIIYMNDSLHPIIDNGSAFRTNLVIVYGNRKSFVLEVLNRLNEVRDTFNIRLIGLPTWERLNDMNNNQLANLNTVILSSDYLDYSNPAVNNFIGRYRESYSMEPDALAYLGFDITYYFLNSLYLYGTHFYDCLESNPMELLQGRLMFKRTHLNSFENIYWNSIQYHGLHQYKIPDEMMQSPYTTPLTTP